MPRQPWEIRPAKTRVVVTASMKALVETKARDSIERVMKPKHILPPEKDARFNYVSDIGAKWYRNYFYFFSTYACPSPKALAPSFEVKFARMEPLRDGTFALYFLRHTGEWVGIFDALTLDESIKTIEDSEWFTP